MDPTAFKSLGELRLQVDDYFREEIFKIDEYTEKKLAESNDESNDKSNDESDHEWFNKNRDELIQGVEETRESNMKHLNEVLIDKVSRNKVIDSRELFKPFCFVIDFENFMCLFISECFVSSLEIERFRLIVLKKIRANEVEVNVKLIGKIEISKFIDSNSIENVK
jgi:hypothetical protein